MNDRLLNGREIHIRRLRLLGVLCEISSGIVRMIECNNRNSRLNRATADKIAYGSYGIPVCAKNQVILTNPGSLAKTLSISAI